MMIRRHERLTYPDYGRDEIQRDFEAHLMFVDRDDGVYRHLRFRGPTSNVYWFDLVTWPSMLVINGDCGTYAFSRVEDMFQFFRDGNGKARINPSYWAEKLHATDCHGRHGHVAFSEWKARSALASEMRSLREQGAGNDVVRNLRDCAVLDEDAGSMIRSVTEWGHGKWRVHDFWEENLDDYTRGFIWNLHAIVWGIQQYDASKVAVEEPQP